MSATASLTTITISIDMRKLVLNAIGEYTSESVAADPVGASNLRLEKQADGNYRPAPAETFDASGLAAVRRVTSIQASLNGLRLGG